MKYRNVGASGLKVSQVALGSWMTDLKGSEAAQVAQDTVRLAYDKGVNFFDCADAYSGGRGGEVLGPLPEGLSPFQSGDFQQGVLPRGPRRERTRPEPEAYF